MASISTLRPQGGGLSHLVEAATALTDLAESGVRQSVAAQTPKSVVSDDDDSANTRAQGKVMKKREIFPQKLMEILADTSLSDIVSWLPHGRSFVIIRPDIFTEQVLPKYLPPVDARTSTKYPSFTRKLNRWGFRQATRGPDTGAFHHPLFRKDQPELCTQMVCQKSRERQAPGRKTLPPKKRSVMDRQTNDLVAPATRLISDSSSATNVSADDRSITSFANSTTSCSQGQETTAMNPPVSFISGGKELGRLPFISNDQAFVAKVVAEREKQEVMKVAKAMLYDAYTQALRQQKL